MYAHGLDVMWLALLYSQFFMDSLFSFIDIRLKYFDATGAYFPASVK